MHSRSLLHVVLLVWSCLGWEYLKGCEQICRRTDLFLRASCDMSSFWGRCLNVCLWAWGHFLLSVNMHVNPAGDRERNRGTHTAGKRDRTPTQSDTRDVWVFQQLHNNNLIPSMASQKVGLARSSKDVSVRSSFTISLRSPEKSLHSGLSVHLWTRRAELESCRGPFQLRESHVGPVFPPRPSQGWYNEIRCEQRFPGSRVSKEASGIKLPRFTPRSHHFPDAKL